MSGAAIGVTVILLLACGALAEGIAEKRGRSGGGWFVVGFLLGPVGILLALTGGAGAQARPSPGEPMKRCPFCAEMIKAAAIKCRYCQSEMPTAVMPRATPTPAGTVVCRSCGHDVRHEPGGACPDCGAMQPVTSTGRAFVSATDDSGPAVRPAFLRGLAVVLLMIVVVFVYLTITQEPDPPASGRASRAKASQPAPEKRPRRR